MRSLWNVLIVFALLSSAFILLRAEEDAAEGEAKEETEQSKTEERTQREVDPEAADLIGPSPDVQSSFLFTNLKTGASTRDLIAGHMVKLLVGFANKGEKDFIVKHCETSFRYPMDFSYHIQNFSAVRYERKVQPKEEATFDYAFIPSDAFVGRPLGLVVNLHYVDTDGNYFVSAVFNETMTIQEDESGFNTETYFMYVVLGGFVVVLLLLGQQWLSKWTKGAISIKGSAQSHPKTKTYEMGTNKNDVDFEWIPRNHLEKKSPKLGSPRNRKQPSAAAIGAAHFGFADRKDGGLALLGDATDEVGEENEYDEAEGVVRLLRPDTLQSMKLTNQRESETVDERGTEELGQEMFLLGDGEAFGGQRMAQLRKCRQRLQKLTEQREKCDRIVRELGDKYQSVAEKTSSLHNACDRMMSEQTQLATANEQIGANLHYYQRYEWLIKKLATPKLSLTGTLFTQILSSVHECLQYLRAHPEQREASSFIHKYEQCLSRSLTAVKAGVLSDLESCRQDVLYRQHRFSQSAAVHQSTATALSFVDDDTFALLYGVFGVKANAIRNAFSQAHQFFADSAEYQTVVAECEHEYFAIRDQLLRPIVHSTIQTFCDQCQNSSCTLTRGGCTFLLRLCDDEFRLYRQFFVLGEADTRASMTPTTPASLLFSFWPAQPHSNQFDAFIEGLCRVLYDTLRPLIVHNPHLETLAQLCTLLKVEMIDERCAAFPSSSHPSAFPPPFSASSPTEAMPESVNMATAVGNSRAGFARVMSELVADIVERIVYRTSLFAQSDILDYNPAPGDLVYPERLMMMRDINQGRMLTGGASTESEIAATTATANDEKGSSVTPLLTAKLIQQSPSSTSPIDQHCLWYPTVRRTVMCLSKLYRCLDATVFLNVSRELLDACCQSLERAVDRIRTLPIKPAHATLRSKSNRSLDAELFIIKHLLILREQTSPFRQLNKQQERSASTAPFLRQPSLNEAQINPQFDYSLDLSKYTQSMFQLLNVENRARWFEFGSNNAFLSLLLLSPIHVSELQTDSRRIIESHLKRWCHSMIGHVSGILLGPLAQFQTSIERLQAEQEQRAQEQKNPLDVTTSDRFSPRALHDCCADAFKRLKQQWPEVRAAFTLYIGVLETEEILLQPIRKGVSNAFNALNSFAERHYDTEQRQIISAPNQEQIWLILNAIATSAIDN
ncbi:hypothetical protein GPALN_003557 [Globodera pallida]|nr:hypothetical protein GPALN_003557 [Globodera pallida]